LGFEGVAKSKHIKNTHTKKHTQNTTKQTWLLERKRRDQGSCGGWRKEDKMESKKRE